MNSVQAQTSPLAQALPGAQFGERHARRIPASRDAVWDALHDLRVRDLTVTKPLSWLRAGGRTATGDQRLLDQPSPVVVLDESRPAWITAGRIAKPWQPRPDIGPVPESLDALRVFDEPGWLKYGMEFTIEPDGEAGSVLRTVTLCEATDRAAWRRFVPYWALIRPWSGLIRRDVLAAVARRATQVSER